MAAASWACHLTKQKKKKFAEHLLKGSTASLHLLVIEGIVEGKMQR